MFSGQFSEFSSRPRLLLSCPSCESMFLILWLLTPSPLNPSLRYFALCERLFLSAAFFISLGPLWICALCDLLRLLTSCSRSDPVPAKPDPCFIWKMSLRSICDHIKITICLLFTLHFATGRQPLVPQPHPLTIRVISGPSVVNLSYLRFLRSFVAINLLFAKRSCSGKAGSMFHMEDVASLDHDHDHDQDHDLSLFTLH